MNNSPFFIYRIDATQVSVLRMLAIQTFNETFASTNTPENMNHYFERCFNERILKKELQDPDSWFWFIETEGKLAGYLKVNVGNSQTELQEELSLELERIYILKGYYGRGVGAALMEHAVQFGKEKGKEYLWLGVYEKNFRALRFYEKYGFEEFGEHVFMMGKQPQRDILLRLNFIEEKSAE